MFIFIIKKFLLYLNKSFYIIKSNPILFAISDASLVFGSLINAFFLPRTVFIVFTLCGLTPKASLKDLLFVVY